MKTIFELVDTSDYEMYHTLGLYLSLEEALTDATTLCQGAPRTEVNDDYAIMEIRERKIGFSGFSMVGELRATVNWKRVFDESDEFVGWVNEVTT